jgi:molybdate transport system substrate-binding protein
LKDIVVQFVGQFIGEKIKPQLAVLSLILIAIYSFAGCSRGTISNPNEAESTQHQTATVLSRGNKLVEKKLVRIAAASDLKFALEEVASEYEHAHQGATIQTTFGASGTLFAQLTHGAPFDLFLSADLKYPEKLVEQGQALPGSDFPFAVGHLVLWVPAKSEVDLESLGIQAVLDSRVKKLAIANPQLAPYGRAAEAALKSLQVYEKVVDRLVLGENIAQTAQFVESGAAEMGVLSLSLATSPALKNKGRYWRIPATAYPKLEQGGVILKACQNVQTAQDFQQFLTGPKGQQILHKFGFDAPEK